MVLNIVECFAQSSALVAGRCETRAATRCSLADRAAHEAQPQEAQPQEAQPQEAQPLSRPENNMLMARMLQLALREQDFSTAARIRDTKQALDALHPTAKLRQQLQRALKLQDYSSACALRDRIDEQMMMMLAESAKPKFAIGLVVRHKILGYRMLLFGVDHRCRSARGHDNWRCALIQRGEEQPWYHAAVDERDKSVGDNIVYVAEDECYAAAEGTLVEHPITRIMFKGVYDAHACPGHTCYIPCGRDEDEEYP
ncbi:unnamed protein product [Agarophyton chilense]